MKKLILLGDSTCALKDRDKKPETGWGEAFFPFLKEDWMIYNYAKNGYSTKSCLNSGIFSSALLSSNEGDAAIIQFGHNDEKSDDRGTKPWTEFIANICYMITRLEEKSVSVYLATSVPRRCFIDGILEDTHKDYIAATKAASYQKNVPLLDVHTRALIDLAAIGEEESKKYYMNFAPSIYSNYPEGKLDNTHLRPEGALWIAKIVYSELKKLEKVDFIK